MQKNTACQIKKNQIKELRLTCQWIPMLDDDADSPVHIW